MVMGDCVGHEGVWRPGGILEVMRNVGVMGDFGESWGTVEVMREFGDIGGFWRS